MLTTLTGAWGGQDGQPIMRLGEYRLTSLAEGQLIEPERTKPVHPSSRPENLIPWPFWNAVVSHSSYTQISDPRSIA
jgi:hypothetical protein